MTRSYCIILRHYFLIGTHCALCSLVNNQKECVTSLRPLTMQREQLFSSKFFPSFVHLGNASARVGWRSANGEKGRFVSTGLFSLSWLKRDAKADGLEGGLERRSVLEWTGQRTNQLSLRGTQGTINSSGREKQIYTQGKKYDVNEKHSLYTSMDCEFSLRSALKMPYRSWKGNMLCKKTMNGNVGRGDCKSRKTSFICP